MNAEMPDGATNSSRGLTRLSALPVAIVAAILGGSFSAAPADEAAGRDAIAAPSEAADPAPAPKSAEEIELAEIDREIGEAFRTLRARETTARERLAEREAFLLLNHALLARRGALAKQVTAAARENPVFRPVLPPRQPVPGESREEGALREIDAVFDAGVEAIRAAENDPSARQARLRELLEANAEALAARDALRARVVVPPDPATLPALVPRGAVPGETPVESELREIENTIAAGLHAIRRAESDPAIRGARRASYLATQRPLLERQQILRKRATRASLDTLVPHHAAPLPSPEE